MSASQPATVPESLKTPSGATISYHSVGHGPGLIILHGALESSASHAELATALSSNFTVYLPNRRGRALSSPHDPFHNMQTEVDDLEALLLKTDAHFVLGVSSGALITLKALLAPLANTIQKAVIFEPPLQVDAQALKASLDRFDAAIAKNNPAAALVTALKTTEMGPWLLRASPRFLVEPVVKWAMTYEDSHPRPTNQDNGVSQSMRVLAPTMRYDFQLALEMEGTLENFRQVEGTEVLLISGTESPAYLRKSVEELEKVIPGARHVRLKGLDHLATGNVDTGGKPEEVARELCEFLLGSAE